ENTVSRRVTWNASRTGPLAHASRIFPPTGVSRLYVSMNRPIPVESMCVTPLRSNTRLRRPPLINCGTSSSSFAASSPSMSLPRRTMTLVAGDLFSCSISSGNLFHLLQDFHKLVRITALALGGSLSRQGPAIPRYHVARVHDYLSTFL